MAPTTAIEKAGTIGVVGGTLTRIGRMVVEEGVGLIEEVYGIGIAHIVHGGLTGTVGTSIGRRTSMGGTATTRERALPITNIVELDTGTRMGMRTWDGGSMVQVQQWKIPPEGLCICHSFLSLSLSVPGYPYAGSSMPVYYDGVSAGGPGMFYPPYNGPVMYNPPLLSVDDRTLQEYIRKQMYVCS